MSEWNFPTIIELADGTKCVRLEDFLKNEGYKELYEVAKRKIERLQSERNAAREALDRIANPVWWMQEDQKRKTGSINGINGGMAVSISENAEYLKGIARDALRKTR